MLVLGMETPSINHSDLVAAVHVQHVMRDIGSRHVIRDHLHAVGAIGSGCLLNVLTAQHRGRRDGVHGRRHWSSRHHDVFLCACDRQLEMHDRARVGLNDDILLHFQESLRRDSDRVGPDGDRTEFEFSAVAGVLGLRPVRSLSLQSNVCALNGAVLRIVDDAANGSKNRRDCIGRHQQRTHEHETQSAHSDAKIPFRFFPKLGNEQAWSCVVSVRNKVCEYTNPVS